MQNNCALDRAFIKKILGEDIFDLPDNRADPFLDRFPQQVIDSFRSGHPVAIRIGNFRESLWYKIARNTHQVETRFCKGADLSNGEFAEYLARRPVAKEDKPCIVTRLSKDRAVSLAEEFRSAYGPITRSLLPKWLDYFNKKTAHSPADPIQSHPVDFLIPSAKVLAEIKSSGDTDTGKSKSVVCKDMLANYALYGDPDCDLVLAVGYDNSPPGKSNPWEKGSKTVLKHIERSMVMFGEDFCEKYVLPGHISYEAHERAVQDALYELYVSKAG